MNALEANLLTGSMDRLGDTFLQNRLLKQRQEEQALQDAMRRDQLGLQREELTARNEDRAEGRRLQGQANTNLKAYHDAMVTAKTDDDRMRVFSDMIKSGAVTPETLDTMSKAMSEKLGVKVTLKMPEKEKFNTREGHNLELAEQYRKRAAEAAGPAGGGDSDRFLAIAERLERGGQAEDDRVTITEGIGESDFPGGEPPVKVTRKVAPDELDRMRQTLSAPKAGPATTTGTGTMGAGSDRVTVVSPTGKRGTIPKAQLQQALAEGYTLAK